MLPNHSTTLAIKPNPHFKAELPIPKSTSMIRSTGESVVNVCQEKINVDSILDVTNCV